MKRMFQLCDIKIIFILIVFGNCELFAEELSDEHFDELMGELYSLYKDAFVNERTYLTRRIFSNDIHYTLHVQKLRENNGLKTHNLRIEGKAKEEDPIVYINNPVEAKIPNAFITVEQFKDAMFARVQKQKKEFDPYNNLLKYSNKQFKKLKKSVKHTFPPTTTRATKPTTKFRIEKYNAVLDNLTDEIFDHVDHKLKKVTPTVANTTESTTENVTEEDLTTISIPEETVSEENNFTFNVINDETEATFKQDMEVNSTESIADAETTTVEDTTTETSTVPTTDSTTETSTVPTTDSTTETSTVPTTDSTTESTVKTTRTRQARPYVFMGGNNK